MRQRGSVETQAAYVAALPPRLADLYVHMLPAYTRVEFGPEYAKELEATRYIWKEGSYRAGITVHIMFFLLGDLLEAGARDRPERFGRLRQFARSFDFTDVFIKQVTASGRGRARGDGLGSAEVQGLLKGIQRIHDDIDIPHWMMTYFGFALLEQVEEDIGTLSEAVKQYHLQYMTRVYRSMGIPFSDDRELMVDFCREVEREYYRYTPLAAEYTRRLIFLGLITGVPATRECLAATLPDTLRAAFETRYEQLRPGAAALVLGKLLGLLYYPYRRFRNPRPRRMPQF